MLTQRQPEKKTQARHPRPQVHHTELRRHKIKDFIDDLGPAGREQNQRCTNGDDHQDGNGEDDAVDFNFFHGSDILQIICPYI
jgi:hypothetical protein